MLCAVTINKHIDVPQHKCNCNWLGTSAATTNATDCGIHTAKEKYSKTKIAQPPLTTTMALSPSRMTSYHQSYCNSARNSTIKSWMSQMTNTTTLSRIQDTNLKAVCGTSRDNWGLQHPILVELQSNVSPHQLATLSSLAVLQNILHWGHTMGFNARGRGKTVVSGIPENSGSCQRFCEGFGTSHWSWISLSCMQFGWSGRHLW